MSDELAQDDEGFEIADFGAEDDEEDDPESSGARRSDRTQPSQAAQQYDPPPTATARKELPRESFDGETIFAVGEDGDRWSEDGSDEERGGLVKKQATDA